MSACEKCWTDAHYYGGDSVSERYGKLLAERKGEKACTPEEQAGPDATFCPTCRRYTLHQWTHECMTGCASPRPHPLESEQTP